MSHRTRKRSAVWSRLLQGFALCALVAGPVGVLVSSDQAGAAPVVAPLPPSVSADGAQWQSFVEAGLQALATTDAASSIALSSPTSVTSETIPFTRGPLAGTTMTGYHLSGTVSDTSGTGATTFTLLGSEGIVNRLTACTPTTGTQGTGTCLLTVEVLSNPASASSATTTQSSEPFAYANVTPSSGTVSFDGIEGNVSPDGGYPCTVGAYQPWTIGSIYGPLIGYGGAVGCIGFYNLSEIVGLYNLDPSIGQYIGTGYSTGASGYTSSISATGYAPCYAPYSPGDAFESAELAEINGSYYGSTYASNLGCAEISYSA